MEKKYSIKFWIIFWLISVLFLVSFYFFLEAKKQPGKYISKVIHYLPIDFSQKNEYSTLSYFADYILRKDDQEKVFLILFQNNMELRPGGGYIGSFGILKIRNGRVEDLQTHDVSNFEERIPPTNEPPYPMKETLGIDSLKLRDSNWSPDFSEDARKADYFYKLGNGQENFDGVIAINTNVLNSILKITGPITLPDYPGEYTKENAVLNLEYQVEKGYIEQGIEKGERKSIMNELANALIEKISAFNVSRKIDLAKVILEDLNNKNIQIYFKNENLEKQAENSHWAGKIDSNWTNDYLMMVDANLNSFKSDYYINRSFDYTVNLSGDVPTANLKITYKHTGKIKDWMTKDYQSYLRIYTPATAWLTNLNDFKNVKFGTEFGKKYFGTLVFIPLNQTKTFEFKYTLKNLDVENYNLLIQKQSGISDLPGKITIIHKKKFMI